MEKIAVCTLHPDMEDYKTLIELICKHKKEEQIISFSYEKVFEDDVPEGLTGIFACVDDMCSLEGLRKLERLHIPIVIVSGSPDYAMEGIRLHVCHYIIRPPAEQEVITALVRLGLPVLEQGGEGGGSA